MLDFTAYYEPLSKKWIELVMKSNLEDLKARVIIMKDYLKAEEDSDQFNSEYANDLRLSILRCKKQIKQLEYAKANPVVLNY